MNNGTDGEDRSIHRVKRSYKQQGKGGSHGVVVETLTAHHISACFSVFPILLAVRWELYDKARPMAGRGSDVSLCAALQLSLSCHSYLESMC